MKSSYSGRVVRNSIERITTIGLAFIVIRKMNDVTNL